MKFSFSMNITILEEKGNEIKFKFEDDDIHTIPNLIIKELLKSPSVEFAGYNVPNPLKKEAILVVKTKKKDPKKSIYEAIEKVLKDVKDFEKSLK